MSTFHYSPRVGRYLRCKAKQQCPFETHRTTVDIALAGGGKISTNGHGKVQEVSAVFQDGYSVGTGAYSQHFWKDGSKMTPKEARIWRRKKLKAEAAEGSEAEAEDFFARPLDREKLEAELTAIFESNSPDEFQAQFQSSSRETKEAMRHLDELVHAYMVEGQRGLSRHLKEDPSRVSLATAEHRRKLEYLLLAGVPLTKTQEARIERGFGWLTTPAADEEEAAYRQKESGAVHDYDPKAAERLREAARDHKARSKAKDSLWNRLQVIYKRAEVWRDEAEEEQLQAQLEAERAERARQKAEWDEQVRAWVEAE